MQCGVYVCSVCCGPGLPGLPPRCATPVACARGPQVPSDSEEEGGGRKGPKAQRAKQAKQAKQAKHEGAGGKGKGGKKGASGDAREAAELEMLLLDDGMLRWGCTGAFALQGALHGWSV